ncbi:MULTISPECIES: hypothetical protein [unclassified Bradyrhizobium]
MTDQAGPSSPLESTARIGVSRSQGQPIVLAREAEYTSAPHSAGGGATQGPPALQPSQAILTFVARSKAPLYAEDASLIEALRPALIDRGLSERTAKNNVNSLLQFGRWLVANNKPGIVARLFDKSLDKDAAASDKSPKRRVLAAPEHLRASQPAGMVPPPSRAEDMDPPFYSEDAYLISVLEKALIEARYQEASAQANGRYIRKLSQWLFANNKPAIVKWTPIVGPRA